MDARRPPYQLAHDGAPARRGATSGESLMVSGTPVAWRGWVARFTAT